LLGACNGYMKTELSEPLPLRYGGAFEEVFIKHVLTLAIKKGDPLEEIKIDII
jgi:hypothetical protein